MSKQIRIIAGLGNPEEQYERTLHNAGFWFVDALRAALDYYRARPGELLVAHDEIDLPPGTVRLKDGGGHGGHNGLRDIIRHCGAEFLRLRLGVGHPGEKSKVTSYVLKRGSSEVERALEQSIDEAIDAMPILLDDGLNAAQKQLHTRD